MGIFLQKSISFIICIVLHFTSSFCYGREDNYLSQFTPSLVKFSNKASVFNVVNYGAKGNGATNDAAAFLKTWDATCKTNGGVMLIPSGYTFVLYPVIFNGSSCQSRIVVQVFGKIVAPPKSQWAKGDFQWIKFMGLSQGLTIEGNGVIDGQGKSWWDANGSSFTPNALAIMGSVGVNVSGVKVQNAPRMHIYVGNSQYVLIFNVTVSSPGDSPNTDGIHLTSVQRAEISDCNIACGDDCISIQNESYDVYINRVICGPGHGFSIGGLGPNTTEAHVSRISVYNSTISNALCGIRIKTWPDGYGTVQNVTYSDIIMTEVHNPIVIDQNYCGGSGKCPPKTTKAVAISDVRYEGIRGTYTETSIYLVCSQYKACRGLKFSSVNLTPSVSLQRPKVDPHCFNAYGRSLTATTPSLTSCLIPEGADHRAPTVPPTMAPI